MSESFIPMYDLESLTEPQRQEYLKAVCKHMGVPDNLNLVALTFVDDSDGPQRLVAYAKRGATENVRNNLKINIESLTSQMIGGSIVFTATAKSSTLSRQEVATGSKFVGDLQGTQLDDAIMTASTRALRRVTLQFVGAGVLDESEVTQRKVVHVTSAPLVPAPQPSVAPSSEPGKDITPLQELQKQPNHDYQKCVESNVPCGNIFHDIGKFTTVYPDKPSTGSRTQEEFEADQAKLRADAIAQLNAQTIAEPAPKKTRKPRTPKPKVDLGPSDPPKPDIKPDIQPAPVTPTPVAPPVVDPPKPDIKPDIAAPVKPRLTPDQVKPFRQRMFRLVNDYLEPHGFAPKEGMGNADKMRALAQVMFPDVSNMNQLNESQWEKYLSTLESKVNTEGPAATIKYIEETIGL